MIRRTGICLVAGGAALLLGVGGIHHAARAEVISMEPSGQYYNDFGEGAGRGIAFEALSDVTVNSIGIFADLKDYTFDVKIASYDTKPGSTDRYDAGEIVEVLGGIEGATPVSEQTSQGIWNDVRLDSEFTFQDGSEYAVWWRSTETGPPLYKQTNWVNGDPRLYITSSLSNSDDKNIDNQVLLKEAVGGYDGAPNVLMPWLRFNGLEPLLPEVLQPYVDPLADPLVDWLVDHEDYADYLAANPEYLAPLEYPWVVDYINANSDDILAYLNSGLVPPPEQLPASTVPEPASLAMLGMGAAMLLRRRRRR